MVNDGPRTAAAVTVTDALPAALTAVTASNGGVVAGGTVTWSLGDLASGTRVVLTVNGTAPGVGVLVDTVHGTSTTPDPDPSNNNGSHPDATVRTVVVAVPPPLNHPPTVADLALQTTANQATFGTVPAGDPDVGQTVSIALLGPPTNGTAFVDPNGLVRYTPSTGFVGRDSLTVRGCDDGVPVLCDNGTVTVVISPVAVGSSVQTTQDTPVSIDPASNDIGNTAPPTVVAGPTSGTVVLRADGTFLYTPDPGFLGSDSFDYQICSPSAPDVCAQARNTITVEPPPATATGGQRRLGADAGRHDSDRQGADVGTSARQQLDLHHRHPADARHGERRGGRDGDLHPDRGLHRTGHPHRPGL